MDTKKTVIVIAAAAIGLFFLFDLDRFLTLEALKENRDALLSFYARNRFGMIAGFMAVYVVQTALSLPGAAVLTMTAGAIFGAFAGTLIVNLAATSGAVVAFLVARYLFRDAVQKRFGPNLAKMNAELEQRGINYLLFLRLVPAFPFFLINLGAGLTSIPLRTFALGTMIGIIPGTFVFCNAGASLASITTMGEIASFRVLGSFALLGLFALAPVLYSKMKKDGGPAV